MTWKAGVLMSHYTLTLYFTLPHVPFGLKISPVYRLAPPTNLATLEREYKFVLHMKILENPIE